MVNIILGFGKIDKTASLLIACTQRVPPAPFVILSLPKREAAPREARRNLKGAVLGLTQ